MKVLETNQRVLTWLNAMTASQNESKWKRLAYFAFSLSALFANVMSSLSSVAFVWKHLSTDLEGSVFAILQFCGKNQTFFSLDFFTLQLK